MISAVAWSALLMGLVGGSHCLVMCSAPCGALVGQGGSAHGRHSRAEAEAGESPVQLVPRSGSAPLRGHTVLRAAAFHTGRLGGYAAAGALAAAAMDSLAWLTQQTTALRPAWTLLHVAVLAWGLLMMVQSRQPAWVEQAGRSVWSKVRPLVVAPGGVFAAGVLWALMPCGLLYSALLVAALSGGPVQGAISMLLFGVGSGLWLVGGPWVWTRVRLRLNRVRDGWGTRAAGALLCAAAGWALWMDLVYKPSLWCR